MTPAEAAFEYLHLSATQGEGAAIRFACAYEDGASEADYAKYLYILDTQLSLIHVEEVKEVA